ncbi:MAG: aminotransferase class V-fold PLP-dependent enzyme [Gemmataceae bacterium]
MPVTANWAFLDHAAVAPLTAPARDAYFRVGRVDAAGHGVVHEGALAERVEEARRRFGELLSADPLDVAFVKNTSEGIGIVAEATSGGPRQCSGRFVPPTSTRPTSTPGSTSASRGVEVRACRLASTAASPLDDSESRPSTAARGSSRSASSSSPPGSATTSTPSVSCAASAARCSSWTPSRGWGPAARRRGRADRLPRRRRASCRSASKRRRALGAGASLVEPPPPRRRRLALSSSGRTSRPSTSASSRPPAAGRAGTLNVGGIVSLGASLELLLAVGIPAVAARIRELTDRLYCGRDRRLGALRCLGDGEWSGIVSLVPPPGTEAESAAKSLLPAGVVVRPRAGRLRVSPHAYNTVEEIDRLVSLLGDLR